MLATARSTRTVLYWSVVTYTALGLLGGIYYRELTKRLSFTGETELAVVHTHLLALGMIVMLVVLCLEHVFGLSQDKRFPAFFWCYTAGMTVTVSMMVVKGTLQALSSTASTSPALAGVAGLGHILLTLALVILLMVLKARLHTVDDPAPADTAQR